MQYDGEQRISRNDGKDRESVKIKKKKEKRVGWPYFLSGELYGGRVLRYDRRMDYRFSLYLQDFSLI